MGAALPRLRMPDGKSLALGDVIKDGSKDAFENFLQLLAAALRSFGAGSEAFRKAHTHPAAGPDPLCG